MKPISFVLCAFVVLLPIVLCQKKVHVAIYYESLCGDSRRFITTQLEPNYQYFEEYIDVEFIPFGKSESYRKGESVSFICQHGFNECFGNKIHSCALLEAETQAAQVQYIACQMLNGYKNIEKCANKAKLSYKNILKCSSSEIATKLQLEAEVKTKKLAAPDNMLSFVPQVVYNDKYDAKKQSRSMSNLRKVLCEEIESVFGKLLSVCEQF